MLSAPENESAAARFERLSRYLQTLCLAVGIVHGTSFLVLLTLTLINRDDLLQVQLTTDFGGVVCVLAAYPVAATLLPFPLITSLFHIFESRNAGDYFRAVLLRGVTWHDWLEYSITNGLMTFSKLTLVGANNVVLLTVAVLVNVTMQIFGYFQQRQNAPRQRSLEFVAWGFLPWAALWVLQLTYLIEASGRLPGFVVAGVAGTLPFSILFVLPLVWRRYTSLEDIEANFWGQVMYYFLSLTSKLYLDWVISLGNTLSPNASLPQIAESPVCHAPVSFATD